MLLFQLMKDKDKLTNDTICKHYRKNFIVQCPQPAMYDMCRVCVGIRHGDRARTFPTKNSTSIFKKDWLKIVRGGGVKVAPLIYSTYAIFVVTW